MWEKVPARRLLAVATRWVFLLLLCCAGTSSLRAVQMQPLSIEQLTQKATLVVSGRVLSKSCLRDLAGRIYTRVELQIVEIWKGSLSTNLFPVVQGGGILGDEKATVSGQVEYSVGEEVVVFLVLNPRGEGVTLGLAQGKFHVGKDARTGERLVHNLFHGEPDPDSRAVSRTGLSPTQRRLTLVELKRRVQGDNP
ncbi:MAG: hypothetical protein DME18_08580 [Verrucomicrobia bacterium]|nr:MAG: hypothetical protein DME18_08580 [Verrucomicrobiota bacterium]